MPADDGQDPIHAIQSLTQRIAQLNLELAQSRENLDRLEHRAQSDEQALKISLARAKDREAEAHATTLSAQARKKEAIGTQSMCNWQMTENRESLKAPRHALVRLEEDAEGLERELERNKASGHDMFSTTRSS